MTSYPLTREQFLLYCEQGLTPTAIGRKIGKDARSVRRWMVRQGFSKPRKGKPLPVSATHKCQFIAGEPGPSDECKCLQPAAEGKSYCEEHYYKSVIYGSAKL